MIVKTVRFGELEVPDEKVITMEKPILGFEGLNHFVLIEIDEIRPFLWFQALDDPAVAFMVVNPLLVAPDYRIEINAMEVADIGVDESTEVETYVIVTITDKPEEMSANLQGPILINAESGNAKQMVLVNSGYHIKHRLFEESTSEAETVSPPTSTVGV